MAGKWKMKAEAGNVRKGKCQILLATDAAADWRDARAGSAHVSQEGDCVRNDNAHASSAESD